MPEMGGGEVICVTLAGFFATGGGAEVCCAPAETDRPAGEERNDSVD
jgi:hypothetical protein